MDPAIRERSLDPFAVQALDLSHNALVKLAGLHRFSNISSIDVSSNRLFRLDGLDRLPHLRSIIASHNSIRSLDANLLHALPRLEVLDISHNLLSSLSLLSAAPSLTRVNASHNALTSLSGLHALTSLASLDLSYNKLRTLAELSSSAPPSVHTLSLAGNTLTSWHDVVYLASLAPSLAHLDVRKCFAAHRSTTPLPLPTALRALMVFLCPKLATLDAQTIQTEDRVCALHLFRDAPDETTLSTDEVGGYAAGGRGSVAWLSPAQLAVLDSADRLSLYLAALDFSQPPPPLPAKVSSMVRSIRHRGTPLPLHCAAPPPGGATGGAHQTFEAHTNVSGVAASVPFGGAEGFGGGGRGAVRRQGRGAATYEGEGAAPRAATARRTSSAQARDAPRPRSHTEERGGPMAWGGGGGEWLSGAAVPPPPPPAVWPQDVATGGPSGGKRGRAQHTPTTASESDEHAQWPQHRQPFGEAHPSHARTGTEGQDGLTEGVVGVEELDQVRARLTDVEGEVEALHSRHTDLEILAADARAAADAALKVAESAVVRARGAGGRASPPHSQLHASVVEGASRKGRGVVGSAKGRRVRGGDEVGSPLVVGRSAENVRKEEGADGSVDSVSSRSDEGSGGDADRGGRGGLSAAAMESHFETSLTGSGGLGKRTKAVRTDAEQSEGEEVVVLDGLEGSVPMGGGIAAHYVDDAVAEVAARVDVVEGVVSVASRDAAAAAAAARSATAAAEKISSTALKVEELEAAMRVLWKTSQDHHKTLRVLNTEHENTAASAIGQWWRGIVAEQAARAVVISRAAHLVALPPSCGGGVVPAAAVLLGVGGWVAAFPHVAAAIAAGASGVRVGGKRGHSPRGRAATQRLAPRAARHHLRLLHTYCNHVTACPSKDTVAERVGRGDVYTLAARCVAPAVRSGVRGWSVRDGRYTTAAFVQSPLSKLRRGVVGGVAGCLEALAVAVGAAPARRGVHLSSPAAVLAKHVSVLKQETRPTDTIEGGRTAVHRWGCRYSSATLLQSMVRGCATRKALRLNAQRSALPRATSAAWPSPPAGSLSRGGSVEASLPTTTGAPFLSSGAVPPVGIPHSTPPGPVRRSGSPSAPSTARDAIIARLRTHRKDSHPAGLPPAGGWAGVGVGHAPVLAGAVRGGGGAAPPSNLSSVDAQSVSHHPGRVQSPHAHGSGAGVGDLASPSPYVVHGSADYIAPQAAPAVHSTDPSSTRAPGGGADVPHSVGYDGASSLTPTPREEMSSAPPPRDSESVYGAAFALAAQYQTPSRVSRERAAERTHSPADSHVLLAGSMKGVGDSGTAPTPAAPSTAERIESALARAKARISAAKQQSESTPISTPRSPPLSTLALSSAAASTTVQSRPAAAAVEPSGDFSARFATRPGVSKAAPPPPRGPGGVVAPPAGHAVSGLGQVAQPAAVRDDRRSSAARSDVSSARRPPPSAGVPSAQQTAAVGGFGEKDGRESLRGRQSSIGRTSAPSARSRSGSRSRAGGMCIHEAASALCDEIDATMAEVEREEAEAHDSRRASVAQAGAPHGMIGAAAHRTQRGGGGCDDVDLSRASSTSRSANVEAAHVPPRVRGAESKKGSSPARRPSAASHGTGSHAAIRATLAAMGVDVDARARAAADRSKASSRTGSDVGAHRVKPNFKRTSVDGGKQKASDASVSGTTTPLAERELRTHSSFMGGRGRRGGSAWEAEVSDVVDAEDGAYDSHTHPTLPGGGRKSSMKASRQPSVDSSARWGALDAKAGAVAEDPEESDGLTDGGGYEGTRAAGADVKGSVGDDDLDATASELEAMRLLEEDEEGSVEDPSLAPAGDATDGNDDAGDDVDDDDWGDYPSDVDGVSAEEAPRPDAVAPVEDDDEDADADVVRRAVVGPSLIADDDSDEASGMLPASAPDNIRGERSSAVISSDAEVHVHHPLISSGSAVDTERARDAAGVLGSFAEISSPAMRAAAQMRSQQQRLAAAVASAPTAITDDDEGDDDAGAGRKPPALEDASGAFHGESSSEDDPAGCPYLGAGDEETCHRVHTYGHHAATLASDDDEDAGDGLGESGQFMSPATAMAAAARAGMVAALSVGGGGSDGEEVGGRRGSERSATLMVPGIAVGVVDSSEGSDAEPSGAKEKRWPHKRNARFVEGVGEGGGLAPRRGGDGYDEFGGGLASKVGFSVPSFHEDDDDTDV